MWSENSFGSYPLPRNWEEVVAEANRLIESGADSEELWETFCATDRVGDVVAVWD